MSLAHGQLPLEELLHIKKAHDVRTPRVCGSCGSLGHSHSMVDRGAEWLHGRCFLARYGNAGLRTLPASQLDRLTLGDLGVAAMRYLLRHRSAP